MADGEWRMDDLILFLYATLGDTSALLASFAVKLFFSFAASAPSAVKL